MSGTTKVPTAARVEALELHAGDLALAVLELASAIELLVISNFKVDEGWIYNADHQSVLTAVDNARALATPEGDDDPEPEPASGALALPRYQVDTRGGAIAKTDNFTQVEEWLASGVVVNVYDRELGDLIIWNGEYVNRAEVA